MKSLRNYLSKRIINIPGWHTNRKIVVIESDDWGSFRMPSNLVQKRLIDLGMNLQKDPYSMYDNLATGDDLSKLFEVLQSVKDKNGNHAIITANTVMVNPDFGKIKSTNFTQYFYEPFTDTLKKSDSHKNAFEQWRIGINAGIFFPQFHGREHVNVNKWLIDLQKNVGSTRLWFENGSFGTSNLVDSNQKQHYMTAWDSNSKSDLEFYRQSITEGMELFKNTFGYTSESIIAPTYCWPVEIESVFKEQGIQFIQGLVSQRIPINNGQKFTFKHTNFQGTKSKSGLVYLGRNAFFEPSMENSFNWIDNCINRINIAFKYHKPATISAHRLNFIGNLIEKNRDENLKLFRVLLNKIVTLWPEVEFMNSVELGKLINSETK